MFYRGTTDEVNACDCCGKANLKMTVIFECEDGSTVHYGSTCATRNTGKKLNVWQKEAETALLRCRQEAGKALRVSEEGRAYLARIEVRHRSNVEPGKASMDFIRAEHDALSLAQVRVAAQFGLEPHQVFWP